jgi:peptide/nickel transport system substrate-binding protein
MGSGSVTDPHLSRRELIRRLALTSAAVLAAPALDAVLAACAGSAARSVPAGGTVSMAIGVEPQVLTPPIHTLAIESAVMELLFPGLLRIARDGSFQPELAQSYGIEDGGMTYRFALRPDLRWQDGVPMTAGDVRFTHELTTDPATKTTYLSGWDRVDRVEVAGDSTVVFHMKEAYAPFLSTVAVGAILPRHVLGAVRDLRHDGFGRNPVGCGPFKMRAWDSGSQIVLEANGSYWRGRPALDRFVFRVVPDAVTQVDQLATGEVDIAAIQPAQWDQVRALSPAVATAAYDDTRYVLVQLDEYDALRDVRVRQALDFATPKDDIVGGVLRHLAVPAAADVPPASPYFDRTVRPRPYDLDRARGLLGEAGFSLRNGVMTRDGRALEVPIYTVSTVPTYVQVAQVLQASWTRIGVRTDVTTMEAATLFSGRGPQWNGRDAALVFSWAQGIEPSNYVNWSSTQIPGGEDDPGENAERYVNPVVDDLVTRGIRTTDPAARRRVYGQLQQILARDVPVIFLYWPKALYAYGSRLHGFAPNAFSGLFDGVVDWTKR